MGVSPWFWSKIGHFSIFLLLRNSGQEHFFYDIVELKKTCFQPIKQQVQKVELTFLKTCQRMVLVQNWQLIQRGQSFALVQNQPFFYFLFLSNISQKNVFYNNIGLKKAFLTLKKNMLKKSKNSDFFIGPMSMVLVQD